MVCGLDTIERMVRIRKWCGRLLLDIHQSYFVIAAATGIISGVVIAMVFRINYFVSPLWIVFAIGLLVIAYLKPKMMFVIVALLAGMIMSFYRCAVELEGGEYIRRFSGKNVVVEGVINGDAETDEDETKFKLTNLKFGNECGDGIDNAIDMEGLNNERSRNGECIPSKGEIYVSVTENEELRWGDVLVLEGRMLDGFGVYAGYLYKPRIRKWERPEPGLWVLRVRDWFAERVKSLISSPEEKLGLSYLLGLKSGLPDELSENLRVVGLTHIVVASGTHLTILVDVARKMFGKVSRTVMVLFSIVFVMFFMCMVGWTPSILRAGIMTMLTLVVWYSGRKMEPWRIILLTMAITLMIEPSFVMNMGWQLSFASYIGIMVLGPELIKFFYGTKKPGWMGMMVLTTMAATMMTLPITLYYYGTLSLVSVVANLLILPTLPYVMGLVFAVGVIASVPMMSTVIAWITKILLRYHIVVVEWLGGMKEFLVEMPKYQRWVWWIYVVIAIVVVGTWIGRKRNLVKYC